MKPRYELVFHASILHHNNGSLQSMISPEEVKLTTNWSAFIIGQVLTSHSVSYSPSQACRHCEHGETLRLLLSSIHVDHDGSARCLAGITA